MKLNNLHQKHPLTKIIFNKKKKFPNYISLQDLQFKNSVKPKIKIKLNKKMNKPPSYFYIFRIKLNYFMYE